MEQKITGFHLDSENDWVAELACHHGQHVRHNPPFFNRPWVVTKTGREDKIGDTLNCVKCDQNAPYDEWYFTKTKTPLGKIPSPLPMRQGVSASRVWLPKPGDDKNKLEKHTAWPTILEFLIERFPFISEKILRERMERGDIVAQDGSAFDPNSPYQAETFLFYYREVPDEIAIPFKEKILFKDDNIIVVDKPHFLPVTPTGRFVRECVLSRLKHHYQSEDISPIHRLDRDTAGVMIFSCNKDIRGAYQHLFQKRQVDKTYEAIAGISQHQFPLTHCSNITKSETHFIMQEEAGKANSETHVDIIESKGELARYLLKPRTGRQHQLRVHMMSLGVPILNDAFYPELLPENPGDYSKPLQLLAKNIAFKDPITGEERYFESHQSLSL